jgi:hypothetical protein
MSLPSHSAKHFRDVHFGGNWTASGLREVVKDLSWQEATAQVHSFNTIATLLFHVNYFVEALIRVLREEPINASDKLSFAHPPINSQEDLQKMLQKTWDDAETAAQLIEKLPASQFDEVFVDEKYGTYFRNIHGIIEHIHYHLGQIALIKKLVREQS